MPIEAKSPALLDLIDETAPIEKLCAGFQFVEGPIWNPKEQCLYFSDIPAGIRYRWLPAAPWLPKRAILPIATTG
jgi:gluconolactonase